MVLAQTLAQHSPARYRWVAMDLEPAPTKAMPLWKGQELKPVELMRSPLPTVWGHRTCRRVRHWSRESAVSWVYR